MLVTMSGKERCRLPIIQAVVEKRLRRRDAASQFQLTGRRAGIQIRLQNVVFKRLGVVLKLA